MSIAAAVGAERQRQELLGFRVPSAAKEPALYAMWRGEAERRASRGTADAKIEPPPPPTASSALLEMNMAELLRQSSTSADLLSIAIQNTPPAESEVRELLRLLEFLVSLHFRRPKDHVVVSTVLSLRSDIANLHRTGILGNTSLHQETLYTNVNALYELFCFRRLVLRWSRMPSDDTRRTAVTTALAIVQRVDSLAHRKLVACLETMLLSNQVHEVDVELLQRLVEEAAKENPWQFPTQTALALEQALGEPVSKPCGVVVTVEDRGWTVPTTTKQQQQHKRRRSESPDDDLPLGEVLRRPTTAARTGGTEGSLPLPRAAVTTSRLAGLFRHDEARPVIQAADPFVEGDGDDVQVVLPSTRVVEGRKVTFQNSPASHSAPSGRPDTPVTAVRHAYPCRSKYHTKYSVPEKHASRECSYCAVCHLMEILFNGCVGGCAWKHDPTPKKLALHLKRFPSVYGLALQQYDALLAGERLRPIELP